MPERLPELGERKNKMWKWSLKIAFVLSICCGSVYGGAVTSTQGRGSIDKPVVSTGYDNAKGRPVGVTNAFPAHIKRLWASTWIHDAPRGSKIMIEWFYQVGSTMRKIYEQSVVTSRTVPVIAPIYQEKGEFPSGQYAVRFILNNTIAKTTYFSIGALPSQKKSCSNSSREKDNATIRKALKHYPEISRELSVLKLTRLFDAKHDLSIIVPGSWEHHEKEDEMTLSLWDPKDHEQKFKLNIMPGQLIEQLDRNDPQKMLRQLAEILINLSAQEASKKGMHSKQIGKTVSFRNRGYLGLHLLLHRTGKKGQSRWESVTLMWNGKRVYMLVALSGENKMLLGEFLSLLRMKSLCSETPESGQ